MLERSGAAAGRSGAKPPVTHHVIALNPSLHRRKLRLRLPWRPSQVGTAEAVAAVRTTG